MIELDQVCISKNQDDGEDDDDDAKDEQDDDNDEEKLLDHLILRGELSVGGRVSKAFMDGCALGIRMACGAVIAGLLCIYAVDSSRFQLCFLIPLNAVLAVGPQSLSTTLGLSTSVVIGTCLGGSLALLQAMALVSMTSLASTLQRVLIGLLVFANSFVFAKMRRSLSPLTAKLATVFSLLLLLTPLTVDNDDDDVDEYGVLDVAKVSAEVFVANWAGAAIAVLVHVVLPRRRPIRAARRRLAAVLRRAAALFHSVVDEKYARGADRQSSVCGETQLLLELRVLERSLIESMLDSLAHIDVLIARARQESIGGIDTQGLSAFCAQCRRFVASLQGMRRALLEQPSLSGPRAAWDSAWNELRTNDTIGELRRLCRIVCAALRSLAVAVGPELGDDEVGGDITSALNSLLCSYRQVREHIYYHSNAGSSSSNGDGDDDDDDDDDDARPPPPTTTRRRRPVAAFNSHHVFFFYVKRASLEVCELQVLLGDARHARWRRCADWSWVRARQWLAALGTSMRADALDWSLWPTVRSAQVAGGVAFASLLVLLPSMQSLFEFAVWAPVTTAFVSDARQASGTFGTAAQRIEGTVAGSIAAYLVLLAAVDIAPVLLVLTFLVTFAAGYVRTSTHYAYAGLVAAFTLQIIVFSAVGGDASRDEVRSTSQSRIELNLIGALISVLFALLPPMSSRTLLIDSLDRWLTIAIGTLGIYFGRLSMPPAPRWSHSTSTKQLRSMASMSDTPLPTPAPPLATALVDAQAVLVRAADAEPQLWRRPFDAPTWYRLLTAQRRVGERIVALDAIVRTSQADLAVLLSSLDIGDFRNELLGVLNDLHLSLAAARDRSQWQVRIAASKSHSPLRASVSFDATVLAIQTLVASIQEAYWHDAAPPLPTATVLAFFALTRTARYLVDDVEQLWLAFYSCAAHLS
jgi:Fusaric acid resistance protein-like